MSYILLVTVKHLAISAVYATLLNISVTKLVSQEVTYFGKITVFKWFLKKNVFSSNDTQRRNEAI